MRNLHAACLRVWVGAEGAAKKVPPFPGHVFSRRGCCATQDARWSVVKIAAGAAFNLDISEDPADKERTSGCVSCRQMSGGCLRGTAEIVAASCPPQRADVVGCRKTAIRLRQLRMAQNLSAGCYIFTITPTDRNSFTLPFCKIHLPRAK